jgi:protein gp37
MADVFEDRRDLDSKRTRLWDIIEKTKNLDWLLLTKRPQNIRKLAPWREKWPANVWLGSTAENQRWLEKRVPILLEHNAKVLFLSCEPLLGPLDLSRWTNPRVGRRIDWVIGGGESGHHARPMHPEWITSLRDQCLAAGVRFHFKQWGNWGPIPPNKVNGYRSKAMFLSNGNTVILANMGKKDAGRRLQGRTWDEFPAVLGQVE